MTRRPILAGHKRIGKRFIPPLKQLDMMQDVSFINDLLPELIWLGLINDNLGFLGGANFFEKIVIAANQATKDTSRNWALTTQLGSLSEDEKLNFLHLLTDKDILIPLRNYICPITQLYESCPIAFIGQPTTKSPKEELVKYIKHCVRRHLDKFETPGTFLNGMIMISSLASRSLHFPRNMKIPDLNSIIDAPESTDAKMAGSLMRSFALAMFGEQSISNAWARHFWNTNYILSKCEFD